MCIKNINMNSLICKSVKVEKDMLSFNGVTDILYGEEQEDKSVTVGDFDIITYVNVIQSSAGEKFDSNYECSVRISSFTGEMIEVARFELGENIIETKQKQGVICKSFGTRKILIPIRNFVFPEGEGDYILKIFIRAVDDSEEKIPSDIQFMYAFKVKCIDKI